MQKAEAQHNHAQNQPVVRQGKGASLESPQGEQITQLEAMAEGSPQAGKLMQLAATVAGGPRMAAQRKAADAIHSSPQVSEQRKQLDSLVGGIAQREEAEEPLQPKISQQTEASAKPNNTGLPDNLKSGIESLSGMSMDNVKVHYNSSQPAQLNALAYAQGTDIHVAPGQEQHLPHEAWHVVQQAQGRVQPTMQMKEGVPVNDDKSLEQEADVMGAKAALDGVVQGRALESGFTGSGAKNPVCALDDNAAVAQRAKLGTGKLDSARSYVNWYFSGGNPKRQKGDALRELYRQIGIDNDSPIDRQTKAKLVQDGVIDEQDVGDLESSVGAYLDGGKKSLPPERKNLPPNTWRHIWRGDFNANKNKATGYHWKGKGGDSWLEGTGNKGSSQADFYEEEVKVRDDKVDAIHGETGAAKNGITGKIKDDKSTFFPDSWNESEVKDAVETRDSSGKITSKSADGITLVKSGDTIYPAID